MDFATRPRAEAEIDACVVVLRAVHAADRYPLHWPESPARWLAPRDLLEAWVATSSSGIVGHVALQHVARLAATPLFSESGLPAPDRLAVVSRLFVSTTARRRGIGAALLSAAAAGAIRRGLRPVLEVVDSDAAAIALYERSGWRRVGCERRSLSGREVRIHGFVGPDRAPNQVPSR
jgi:GNAT superfamily N-acetyltransferase